MKSDRHFWESSNLSNLFTIVVFGSSTLVYLAATFLIFSVFFTVLEQDNGFVAAGKAVLDKEMIAALVAFIGMPFVIWRTWAAVKNTKTASEEHVTNVAEHITNRLNKAVEQLSAVRRVPCRMDKDGKLLVWEEERPTIEARLGGLYALERIARDSERDYFSVMEMVCTYVRQNSPLYTDDPASMGINDILKVEPVFRPKRVDIQKAIEILGNQRKARKDEERAKYDVRLQNTDLSRTDLERLDLKFAWLGRANFGSAYLGAANLTGAWLANADFSNAILTECNLHLAALYSTNFRNATRLNPKILEDAYGVKWGYGQTILPDGYSHPEHWFEPPGGVNDTLQVAILFEKSWRAKLALEGYSVSIA